jgi:protein-disulfide isomerase
MSPVRFIAAAVSLLVFSQAAFAEVAASTPLTKADIPALVKEALMNDPEIIMQALEKLRTQKAEEAKKEASKALSEINDKIFKNPEIPSVGPANADVTIVEFFDYHCGYCKHFAPELDKLLASDKKLRVLYLDFPILSEDSELAARAAIAVNRLDKTKYSAYHAALMKQQGRFEEAGLIELAKKLGVKGDLKAEMAKPEVKAAIDMHRDLAQKLNISGTPALIIGKDVIPGAMSYEELKGLVDNVRNPKAEKPAKPDAK